MKGSVVIAGAVARRAAYGGHVWALLQWAVGFRRLGWSVLFLDRLDSAPGLRQGGQVRGFVELMEHFGLAEAYSLDLGPDQPPVGMSRRGVLAWTAEADFLMNVMGYLRDPDTLGAARLRVFLDIDPGFGQMWRALGLCDVFAGHDRFVTVGLNVGRPECRIPTCGLPWIPTLPPVVLDLWPRSDAPGSRFTSVGSWRGPYDAIEYEGERFGLRAHEFRRFSEVPRASGVPCEIALEIDAADEVDLRKLRAGGWEVTDPRVVARGPGEYRRYVRESRAELMVAKGMYVRSHSGWFSDRTACYLASGRPAVVQDTGLGGVLPLGDGLLAFRTPEEAVGAVREVEAHWPRHAAAARELAVERLDSNRVLEGLARAVAA